MSQYSNLKSAITAVIKQNGNNEITGNLLQQTLLAMVNSLGANYQYAGIATPATNPGTPDQNVFYIAATSGVYANFNGITLTFGEVAILSYNGAWTKSSTGIASEQKVDNLENSFAQEIRELDASKQDKLTFDNTPTPGSSNPVTSNGIKYAIDSVQILIEQDIDRLEEEVQTTNDKIVAVESKIPAAASSSNQLADKAFVNSSVATNTATFRGTVNLLIDLSLPLNATEAQVAAALLNLVSPPQVDNNDYMFVLVPVSTEKPTEYQRVDRYKFNGTTWVYEYTLNNSGFTAAQWDAINSGIKAGMIPEDATANNPFATEREIEALDSALSGLDNHVSQEINRIDESIGEIKDVIPQDASDTNPLVAQDFVEEGLAGKVNKDPNAADGEIPVYNPDIQGDMVPSGVNVDELAKKDGYYGSLTAGAAENLVGNKSVSASFLDRTTAGSADVGTGAAMLTSIKGNSIVWNQLVRYYDYNAFIASAANLGITATYDTEKRVFTLNGTATSSGRIQWLLVNSTASANPTTHRYYARAFLSIGAGSSIPSANTFYVRDYQGGISYNDYGYGAVFSPNANATSWYIGVAITEGAVLVDVKIQLNVFDLTQMFGAGKGPTTVAEFKALFPLDYYAYNAGTILPFAAQALKTTGFNQYNHTAGTAELLAGNEYQVSGTYTALTIDGEAVTLDSNGCFIPTKNCTLNVTGGNSSDTCVHLTWSGTRNGEYEPYEEHNLTIDPATILDTNGDLIFPYGGMHGTGTAFDEMKPEVDSFIHYGTRRFGMVDLGDLDWVASDNRFNSSTKVTNPPTSTNINCICVKYIANSGAVSRTVNKSVCIANGGYIYIYDTAYSDAAAFKAAMSGVELIFELATPVTKELATPIPASFYENDWGTESWIPANGETPYTAPCNVEIKYPVNAVDAIRNIPRNFKAPLDVVLTAFQTAGIIASYTLTYDESTQTYECSIVRPTE